MIRIDSDTHFTPMDAFAGRRSEVCRNWPAFTAVAHGALSFDYPARAPFVPEHIKPLRSKTFDCCAPNEECR